MNEVEICQAEIRRLRSVVREMEDVQNDNYYIFVIGYDLMQERFLTLQDTSCDIVFEYAKAVLQCFKDSSFDDDMEYSTYENLQRFISESEFDFENNNKIYNSL